MVPHKRLAFVGLAVIAVAVAAAWWWLRGDDGAVRDSLRLYGNVELREVEVAFKVDGRITEIPVEEGDRVDKGQPLARLDSDRLERAAERVAAQVVARQQALAALEAGSRPEEIRRAQAEVKAARVAAQNSRRTYRRLRELLANSLASREQVDEVRAAAEAAEARLHAAQEVLGLVQAGPRREDIEAARANLQATEAELALARIELEDATLTAPVAGVVRNRILEVGEMASPQRPVITLAPVHPVWVRAYLPETALGRVRPGMPARVTTDTFPDKVYDGWIGFISPTAEFTPKSVQTEEVRTRLVYQVRVMVCNPRGELRLGMPAEVAIPLEAPIAGGVSGNRCPES